MAMKKKAAAKAKPKAKAVKRPGKKKK